MSTVWHPHAPIRCFDENGILMENEYAELFTRTYLGSDHTHSTETAVVYLTDYILEHMDRQMITGAVFIDLKKAFNIVDHECFLFRLGHYRVKYFTL